MDNQEALARLLTMEQGKSIVEARGEVGFSAGYIRWFAEEARRTYGDLVPSPWADRRVHGDQAAGRGHRGNYSVEFPVLHAGPQDWSGNGCRLYSGV